MKVMLFGGRDFTDLSVAARILNSVLKKSPMFVEAFARGEVEFIHGDANGADKTLGEVVEFSTMKTCTTYPADWNNLKVKPCIIGTNKYGNQYNKLAGMNRNTTMVDECDMAIGVWDGVSNGTRDSITKLKKANKPLYLFNYEGEEMSHV